MPRLPTVKLKNKKTGKTRIINATDYQRDIARYATSDWGILSNRGGDATTEQIVEQAVQSDVEKHRNTDKAREKKFHDAENRQTGQRINTPVVTEKSPPSEDTKPVPLDKGAPSGVDWTTLRWPEARKHIKGITGSFPKNKEDAIRLMKDK